MISIELGNGLALMVPELSPVAKLLQLSPFEALRRVRTLLDVKINGSSLVDDWLAHAVVTEPGGRVDEDELFVDYFRFVQLVAGRESDRLSHKAFARALDERGLARGRRRGRAVRIDCRIAGRRGLAARASFVSAVQSAESVEAFIAARCRLDRTAKVRASVMFEAYGAWCRGEGIAPCSTKEFPAALIGRGLRRKHSNGRWWLGIVLLPAPLEGEEELLSGRETGAEPAFSRGAGMTAIGGLFGG